MKRCWATYAQAKSDRTGAQVSNLRGLTYRRTRRLDTRAPHLAIPVAADVRRLTHNSSRKSEPANERGGDGPSPHLILLQPTKRGQAVPAPVRWSHAAPFRGSDSPHVGCYDSRRERRNEHKSGFVLVAVLVVVMLASMVVISLMFHLRAEETASAAGTGSEQAWTAAMSGLYEAMRVAAQPSVGDLNWQDDPEAFRGRMVLDDGSDRWFFTLYAMGDPDSEDLRFGLIDESSKLNINTATEAMLTKLPKMTPYLVQGLLDFLDTDNIPRPEGAEQEYYNALPYPYAASNASLSTFAELLLVRGFTPSVVYGEDANLNYRLDPGENDSDERFPPDNKDGKLDYGLRQFLTVSSYDLNENNARAPRIDLNDTNATLVEAEFPPAVVKYIAALRRNKTPVSHPAELLEAKGKFKDENGAEVEMVSGVGKAELADVLDRFTASKEHRLPGLINVNTASADILKTIPDIDEALADSIVTARRGLTAEQRRTPAWLFEEALVDATLFKKIAPHITARSFQFHGQVIGYGVPSGRFRVLEAVIDLAGPKPAIAYLRDITRLGMPFKIEVAPDEQPFAGNTKRGTQHYASLIPRQKSSPSRQPQRGCDPKPRVGPSSDLPWVRECGIQPQRGCGPNDLDRSPARRVATPSGWIDYFIRLPRVARSSQPWALGRSPFGAGAADLRIWISRQHHLSHTLPHG